MGATRVEQLENNLQSLKIASEWTKEKEERMTKILSNEPTARINFIKMAPDTGRRSQSVGFSFTLGKLERKRKIMH